MVGFCNLRFSLVLILAAVGASCWDAGIGEEVDCLVPQAGVCLGRRCGWVDELASALDVEVGGRDT